MVPVLPALASLATFLLQAYTEGDLETTEVFTVLALFNVLRFPLAVLPMGVKAAAEAREGFRRLSKFMMQDNDRKQLPEPGARTA